jgi:hypothetical protein
MNARIYGNEVLVATKVASQIRQENPKSIMAH